MGVQPPAKPRDTEVGKANNGMWQRLDDYMTLLVNV